MLIKQVRLSHQAKEQLGRLKAKTGIRSRNVLCRWALVYSLAEQSVPTDSEIAADSNVEMSWHTFGGEYYEIYEALIRAWCLRMGLPTDDETVVKYFRLNLERGIAHLAGTGFIRSVDDLLMLAVKKA
jgi:DNA sulfur modification protein dndE